MISQTIVPLWLLLSLASTGCAPGPRARTPSPPLAAQSSEARAAFETGIELLHRSDTLRAEQYLLLAARRGYPEAEVLPALIRRFDEAREASKPEVVAWGTGAPRREFLHVDDLADACAFLLRCENPPDWINVGTGTDVTIRELTELVASVTGYRGRITWDSSKPDGTPRKLLDVSKLSNLGWRAKIALREGLEKTYASYRAEKAAGTST